MLFLLSFVCSKKRWQNIASEFFSRLSCQSKIRNLRNWTKKLALDKEIACKNPNRRYKLYEWKKQASRLVLKMHEGQIVLIASYDERAETPFRYNFAQNWRREQMKSECCEFSSAIRWFRFLLFIFFVFGSANSRRVNYFWSLKNDVTIAQGRRSMNIDGIDLPLWFHKQKNKQKQQQNQRKRKTDDEREGEKETSSRWHRVARRSQ